MNLTYLRTTRALLAALAAILMAGCSGSSDNVQLSGPDPTTLSLTASTPNGLTATLAQDKSTIPVSSGTVTYTLSLTNMGTAAVTVLAPSDTKGGPLPPVTLTVTGSDGEGQVYPNASNGTPVPGPQQTVTLQPGGFLSETITLPGAFPTIGRYAATATFTTGGAATVAGPLTLTAR